MTYHPGNPVKDPASLSQEQWLRAFEDLLNSTYSINIDTYRSFLTVAPEQWCSRLKTQRHPLYTAVEYFNSTLLADMFKAGALLPQQIKGHETLMNRCIGFWGDDKSALPYVKVLVGAGVNLNEKGFNGETALLKAAKIGDIKLMNYMFKNGADPTISNDKGISVLDCFLLRDNVSLMERFLPQFLSALSQEVIMDKAVKSNANKCVDKMLGLGWEVGDETVEWVMQHPEEIGSALRSQVEHVVLMDRADPASLKERRTPRL